MSRPRVREIHWFLQSVMDAHSCTTIPQLSAKTGVPAQTLYAMSSRNHEKGKYQSILLTAQALGLTADEFLQGMISPPPKRRHG